MCSCARWSKTLVKPSEDFRVHTKPQKERSKGHIPIDTMANPEPVPSGLSLDEILSRDPDGKSCVALCTQPASGEKAIVVLQRKPWADDDVRSTLEGASTHLDEIQRNDKFSKYHAQPPPAANQCSITLICPANEYDIAKYSEQKKILVRETTEIYQTITRPFVESIPVKQIAWVQAIIDRKAEMEKLLWENDGCMLLPDTKWDLKDNAAMYTLAILKDPKIRSVRDLRGEHVPMLRDIQTGVLAKLREAYGVEPHTVRAYMHYLPSFWWAHIHFSALTCPNLGVTTSVGKAILLDDIIDHLERDSSFFANANLTICIGEKDPLFSRLEQGGFTETSSPRPTKTPKTKN